MNKITKLTGIMNSFEKNDRLQARLKSFEATDPVSICTTNHADIWSVRLWDGSNAVLKLYHHASMRSEAHGARVLKAADGHACVDILATTDDAILMGKLEGPSLGDLSRNGEDTRANTLLVQSVKRFHSALPADMAGLPTLDQWFKGLLTLKYGPDCPADLASAMKHATDLALHLLQTSHHAQPLHGDVHHDNAIFTQDGVKLIDAKGISGDLAYEMANSFRNPSGTGDLLHDPNRAKALAAEIHAVMGITPARQLAWAAAKCALSIAWRAGSTLNGADPDSRCLSMLLDLTRTER